MEYHDPDYPEASTSTSKETPTLSEDEKVEKIKVIVHREFSNELQARENEVMLLDQKLTQSRRMLHRLRYVLVSQYYQEQKLQLTPAQIQDEVAAQHEPRARSEVASLLHEGQKRLHPSVRKLLGKQTADLDEILFRSRAPRNKTRKDYSAMVRAKNYTTPESDVTTLRRDVIEEPREPKEPKKQPRRIYPKISSVVTLDEAARNQVKHRYRLVVGNTSKYAPAASQVDRSTHKWLLYIRGPDPRPDLSRILTGVSVRLHHSYAPHHTVHLHKPPFHISRRGWGEFPAQIELQFALPQRNRPATVEHTIKLDRHYTGLQTLGAETIVDVWLYSTPEMLEFEFKEEEAIIQTNIDVPTDLPTDLLKPKEEPIDEVPNDNDIDKHTDFDEIHRQDDSWLDFFSKDTTELDVDDLIIKPTKKVEEKTDIENFIDTNIINKDTMDTEQNDNHVEFTPNIEDTQTQINSFKTVEIADLPNELLTQPTSPKKRIMKYMDPTTGKIYYLEMDRNLDLTKVQEIVINSKGIVKTAKIGPIKSNGLKNVRKNVKKGVSLLKPEVKSLLKSEVHSKQEQIRSSFNHIENDHCYLATPWNIEIKKEPVLPVKTEFIKKEKSVYDCLCSTVRRFTSVRTAVNYLLKKICLVNKESRDPDFVKHFPFVVETEEKYWKLDFAKRRNIEWSRSKLITKILSEHFNSQHDTIWRTKQVLIYSRLHGFFPIRPDSIKIEPQDWNLQDWALERQESSIKETYPSAADISCLTLFDSCQFKDLSDTLVLTDSEDEVEVVNEVQKVKKKEFIVDSESLTVLPVNENDRLKFMFVEKKCADIGIELRNEDVGNGYSYSAVHAVLLSAMRSFAEELVRSSLAAKLTRQNSADLPPVWMGWSSSPARVSLRDVYVAARGGRLRAVTGHAPGTEKKDTHAV